MTSAVVVVSMLGGLLVFAVRHRANRVERIRNELRQLEVGMTTQEVRESLTILPNDDGLDGRTRPGDPVVVWSFSTVPRIEAVQPHLVFDGSTGRLVEIVLGTVAHPANQPSADEEEWLGDWLARNEPLVREYLLELGPDDVGQPLEGAKLTDGARLFAGDVFLRKTDRLPGGIHGWLLQRDDAKFACLWADAGAPAFRLPTCEDPTALEHEVISRDVYTYGDIQPGGRIVIIWCPPGDWLTDHQNTQPSPRP